MKNKNLFNGITLTFLILTLFGCKTNVEYGENWYNTYNGKSFDKTASNKLVSRFGEPVEIGYEPLEGFDKIYFFGPNFTKVESITLVANYEQELTDLNNWIKEEGVKQGLNENYLISSANIYYEEYKSKRDDIYDKYEKIYRSKIGEKKLTFKDLANAYMLKNRLKSINASLDSILSNFTLDDYHKIKYKSIQYTYKTVSGVKGINMGYTEDWAYNYLNAYLTVYVDLDGKVRQINEYAKKCDKEELREIDENGGLPWILFSIIVVIGYTIGRYFSSKTNCVIINSNKDLIILFLASIAFVILLYRFSEPTINLLVNDPFFWITIFILLFSFYFSKTGNPKNISHFFISIITKVALLLLIPILVAIFIGSFGMGKKDMRFKDGTKGNTQTKATGIAGALLVLVLGSLIKNNPK
jgi:hypothetical protein